TKTCLSLELRYLRFSARERRGRTSVSVTQARNTFTCGCFAFSGRRHRAFLDQQTVNIKSQSARTKECQRIRDVGSDSEVIIVVERCCPVTEDGTVVADFDDAVRRNPSTKALLAEAEKICGPMTHECTLDSDDRMVMSSRKANPYIQRRTAWATGRVMAMSVEKGFRRTKAANTLDM
ncbi:unnamed protein product, partial [Ascophyllum nodosum]